MKRVLIKKICRNIVGVAISMMLCVVLFSCGDDVDSSFCDDIDAQNAEISLSDCSVNFIDTGRGDCTLIHLPDGKNILIDCGDKTEFTKNQTDEVLSEFGVKDINAFIITSPEKYRTANANYILENYNVKNIFIPFDYDEIKYPYFCDLLNIIADKNIKTYKFSTGMNILGEDYLLCFLSPSASSLKERQDKAEDNIDENFNVDYSPIIYLDCCGVRFVFVSDATESSFKHILNTYKAGMYKNFEVNGREITLENIDYYKTSFNGKCCVDCKEFINLITPKNVICSLGSGSDETVYEDTKSLIQSANKSCKFYRTDTVGSIRVFIDDKKTIRIKSDLDK